jgi:metal-dependent amidase/aminoacylase/carboxypeptidase family protein
MLRQQCRPTDRVNIVVKGGDSAINVITENAEVEFGIRCKTMKEVGLLRERVEKCMEGIVIGDWM